MVGYCNFDVRLFIVILRRSVKSGSLMLPKYLRHSHRYCLRPLSDMRTEVAGNRGHVSLYLRHACEVELELESTSPECRLHRLIIIISVAGGGGGG